MKNSTITTMTGKAIVKALRAIPGFNQPAGWNVTEEGISDLMVIAGEDKKSRYLYAIVESSDKSSITGILWDSETDALITLFTVATLMGTGDVEKFRHSYSVKGEKVICRDFLTGDKTIALIGHTERGNALTLDHTISQDELDGVVSVTEEHPRFVLEEPVA